MFFIFSLTLLICLTSADGILNIKKFNDKKVLSTIHAVFSNSILINGLFKDSKLFPAFFIRNNQPGLT